MLVGQANKGKTTLLLNLTKKGRMVHYRKVEIGTNIKPLSTVGVELGEYAYSPAASKPIITFMTWDFGGQVSLMLHGPSLLVIWEVERRREGGYEMPGKVGEGACRLQLSWLGGKGRLWGMGVFGIEMSGKDEWYCMHG